MRVDDMIVYFNGQFLAKTAVALSPDDRGFLFADGVYEVVGTYNGKLFKAAEHFQRLRRSLREIRITGVDSIDFTAVAEDLLEKNNLKTGDAIVYLQITRGAAPRNHAFPDAATPPTVYAFAAPSQSSPRKMTDGVKVVLAPDLRWARCDIKSVALLPNVLAYQQARELGADEAILVRNGVVTEGSRTNFAAVLDGQFVTHPQNNFILGGITLNVVLELCRRLRIPVKEHALAESDLKAASEMMLLGTTTEITPVVQVNDWRVGGGKPGPVARMLQQAFRELVKRDQRPP